MFRTKKRAKEIEHICKLSLIRKSTKIYKNKLYINNEIVNVETIKIKNKLQIINELAPIHNWINNRVYLLERTNNISTHMFKSAVDIIVCDIRFNVLETHRNVLKNSNIKCHEKAFNIWIAKVGFIDFYNIKETGYIALKAYSL